MRWCSVLALLLLFVGAASATTPPETINWRDDYAVAVQESADSGKPIFLYCTTDSCFWCLKLQASTFSDPVVTFLLNERFIPVKVKGDANTPLFRSLQVKRFPYVFQALPDGTILHRQEGFVEVKPLLDQLVKSIRESIKLGLR